MALITNIITEGNFEKVRNSVAAILGVELAGQYALTTNELFNCDVYVERLIPFDKTELKPAVVNVGFNTLNLDEKDQTTGRYNVEYFVDVICKANDTTSTRGDTVSSKQLHKLLNVIKYILDSKEYKNLSNKTIVAHKEVSVISTADNEMLDGEHITFGRVTLRVTLYESVSDEATSEIEGIDTIVTLDESEKGYKITINN